MLCKGTVRHPDNTESPLSLPTLSSIENTKVSYNLSKLISHVVSSSKLSKSFHCSLYVSVPVSVRQSEAASASFLPASSSVDLSMTRDAEYSSTWADTAAEAGTAVAGTAEVGKAGTRHLADHNPVEAGRTLDDQEADHSQAAVPP